MPDPYIGITDFTDSTQVLSTLEVFNKFKKTESNRKLMVGVMMSYKTLHNLPTKWQKAFPPTQTVSDIFLDFHELINCLHYADYEGIDILNSLCLATSYGGKFMDALQLDMIWPDPRDIKKYHQLFEDISIVLQVGANAMDVIDNDSDQIVEKLKHYENALDYVLFDKSMGRGKGLNEYILRPFMEEVKQHLPHLGLVVAGGLGPKSMHLVKNLTKDFPQLSIDAQGQLRASASALDPIDWGMAQDYLVIALQMFD